MDSETFTAKIIKRNHIVCAAYRHGEMLGLSEVEILRELVTTFVSLQDTAFQKELDKHITSTQPLFFKVNEPVVENPNAAGLKKWALKHGPLKRAKWAL